MSKRHDVTWHVTIFYSYASEDEKLQSMLEKHLSLLKRQGVICELHKRHIAAGTNWEKAINDRINAASIILLLISPDYLASDYCYGIEMQQALKRHRAKEALVIPVLLRPVYLEGAPFADLDYLPGNGVPVTMWKKRDEAFFEIARGIHYAILGVGFTSTSKRSRNLSPIETTFPERYEVPFDHEELLRPPHSFVGRKNDLQWLVERLRQSNGATIAALHGLSGIGKTALAAMAVHELHPRRVFWDGVAVVRCQGLKNTVEVLQRVVARFDPQHRAPDTSALTRPGDLVRQELAGKRILIVLDDLESQLDVELMVAPLLAAGATLLLITHQILPRAAVPPEASRKLDLLPSEEGLELFAQSFGRASTADLSLEERAAAQRIVDILGRHTLAIKLAGAYAADAKRELAILSDQLESNPLIIPEGEIPRAIALTFAKCIDALPIAAQRLLVALAAFPTLEFGRRIAVTLAEMMHLHNPEEVVYVLILRSLVDASINESMPQGSDRERLRLHPLLRSHVQANMQHITVDLQQAQRYHASYYLDMAALAEMLYLEGGEATKRGLHLFETEWDNILAGQTWAAAGSLGGDLAAAWMAAQYPDVAIRCLSLRRPTAERIQWLETGLNTARRLKERTLEGTHLGSLGSCYAMMEDYESAINYYVKALKILRTIPDRLGISRVLVNRGNAHSTLGQHRLAFTCYEQALQISREFARTALTEKQRRNAHRTDGYLLKNLGSLYIKEREFERAEGYFQQALDIARELQDIRLLAATQLSLGNVYLFTQDRVRAIDAYKQSISIAFELQDDRLESNGRWNLAQVLYSMDKFEEASMHAQKAYAIYKQLVDKRMDEVEAFIRRGE